MLNTLASQISVVIIITTIFCRINTNAHKKNYNKFLCELKNSDIKNDKELDMIMKYMSKHFERQETSLYTYVMMIMLALGVIFNNIQI